MRVNTNIITIKDDYAEIQTVKGEIILIDISDVDNCKKHSWSIDSKGYPSSGGKGLGTTRLHRFLLQPPKGMQVDHINHNKLDNLLTKSEALKMLLEAGVDYKRAIKTVDLFSDSEAVALESKARMEYLYPTSAEQSQQNNNSINKEVVE